jgi:hypothetical protein
MNEDIIYLLKTDDIIKNEYVYKIGRSTQPNLKRLNAYPKEYKIIIIRSCIDCIYIERELIELFNIKYKKAYKNEYFTGNENEMICDINKIVDDEYTASLIDKPTISLKITSNNNICYKSLDDNIYNQVKSFYMKYSNYFVCSNIKNNIWWEFKNHTWINDKEGNSIKTLLLKELKKEYETENTNTYIKQATAVLIEKEELKQYRIRINKIILQLSNNRFINTLMNECKNLFYNPTFNQNTDNNITLVETK